MASGGQQPEGFSMVDFDGKHAELVQKLSEISTSMRQCADIVDSFNQIVRHLSLRSTPFDIGLYPQASAPGPSRLSGYPRPERTDALGAHAEGPGAAPSAQGPETYRRPSYSHVGGSMLPPAVPTYHPSGFPSSHPSTSSLMHAMPGPPSYPLQRTGGATSGPGPAGSHESTSLGQRPPEGELTASERASPSKQAKRKRANRTEPVEPGAESDDGTGMGGSPLQDTTEAASETEEAVRRSRQPVRGSEESSEASRMSSRQPGVESARAEDRPTDPATGPSIVVFASGAGTSRPRAPSSRSQAQPSTRARKEKKPRDPNAPKQPPPAYIVYQNEIRETMRARFPGHSPTELVKEIAATWKALPNSERQRYKDYANVEKDRWVAELAAYQATLVTTDESQPARSSEGSFLATAGISDSPPVSSPQHSPRISEAEAESHDVRRVASQDASSSSTTYGYAYQAPLRTSSSFPGPASTSVAGTSSPRPEGGPSYPSRLERPHSRLASSAFGSYGRASPLQMPSPSTGRPHFTGMRPDSRGPSTRLPSFDSLGLGPSLPPAREPSPRPPREHVGGEDEPASKRQKRVTSSSEEGEGDGGFSHPTYEERKGE